MGALDGKTAFITGAGSGIGRAAAHLFAREGAQVVIADLDPRAGRRCEREVRDAGHDARFIAVDVTDQASIKKAVGTAIRRYHRIDTLLNCAGGSVEEDGPVTELDPSVWDHSHGLDLRGTFLCCREVLPRLIDAGGGGVINMGTVFALIGRSPNHAYVAAKGGVIALTRAIAGEYARHRIRANVICPGPVLTERIKQRHATADRTAEQVLAARYERYPFGVGQPGDVATIALFLASDASRLITGAVIPADGGMTAY